MHQVIVIEFTTLDGIVDDPDGSAGTPGGGWAFRHGPDAVAGDKFRLGERLADGTLLLGRRTWQLFAQIFPRRSDPFSAVMNATPKLVLSRGEPDLGTWDNSRLLAGDVADQLPRLLERGDVVVAGSIGLVQTLVEKDLVDEYRLLVFPTILGEGRRLFGAGTPTGDLQLVSVERSGAAVLTCHRRLRER